MNTKLHNASFQRTVLVVEDEAINREILGAILESEYRILYAEDGLDALEKIDENRGNLSLILLDILMPHLDGFGVLEKIRKDAELSKIPVIILTAEKSSEVKSLQMGAADFLSKPYDLPEVILARVRHAIALFEDNQIIQATEHDTLTGLYNRDFFYEYANQIDKHGSKKLMDSIVLNFNRFHLLNELLGRDEADWVLRNIADSLRKIVEKNNGIACRSSSDEFYVYMEHGAEFADFLGEIEKNLLERLQTNEISLRMGVFQDSERLVPLEKRFDRATQACSTLRGRYDTGFAFYSTEMHEKEMFSARLLNDFEKAIEERQFRVSYQPKYNIKGERPRLCSAEALVSWFHPQFGRVRPDSFIPLFEKNGMIQKLDRYVWTEAAKQIRKWKDELNFTVPVSVNVSRVDMYAPDIMDFFRKIVSENALLPSEYYLEVTESAYTDNSQQIVQVVKQMRESGFKVEMDDFGSGYSSLNMLNTIPIDVLKMDMAFIRNISEENKDMHMVELVLDIARYLKVPVVAEGVEQEYQYKLLKDAGCDIIQGYYFSKPLFPEDFSVLIEKEKGQGN